MNRRTIASIERAEASLNENRSLRGETHPTTLLCMSELAQQYREAGVFHAARDLQEQVVERRHQIWGDGDLFTIEARHDLAMMLIDLGQPESALLMQREILETVRNTYGEVSPQALVAMTNLANSLIAVGDFRRADELQTRSVAASTRVHGEDHMTTLRIMSGLAKTKRRLRETEAARSIRRDLNARIVARVVDRLTWLQRRRAFGS